MTKAILLVHAGAGKLSQEIPNGGEEEYKEGLKRALKAGYAVLTQDKSSLLAVEVAIAILEDNPLFTAGRGAVISHSGICELDSSIMDGKTKKAGAVAGISKAKNPISAARAVMENTPYVMIHGSGADEFADEAQLEIVDPGYFITDVQRQRFQQAQQDEAETGKFGTVGAVAIDQNSNLVAGTSTGGLRNARFGRIGDSAIIGAATYANELCAVSCTGQGEFFIRQVIAYDIAALMQYKNMSVAEAADEVIHRKLTNAGGQGGVIVIDQFGNFAMTFNTEGMFRGFVTADGQIETFIYNEMTYMTHS